MRKDGKTGPRDDSLTLGVESGTGREAGPHDRDEVHGFANSTNTVVDVSIRRTKVQRCHTEHILDDLS